MVSEEQVKEALKQVVDPELHINIVDLGLVYDLAIDQETGTVDVKFTLTALGCPLAETIVADIHRVVSALEGVKQVRPELVWSPPWNPSMMSEEARMALGFW